MSEVPTSEDIFTKEDYRRVYVASKMSLEKLSDEERQIYSKIDDLDREMIEAFGRPLESEELKANTKKIKGGRRVMKKANDLFYEILENPNL